MEDIIKNKPLVLTPEQIEKFEKAAEILAQNAKECEQFPIRDGI
jgi:hypothetical protein